MLTKHSSEVHHIAEDFNLSFLDYENSKKV